MNLKLANVIENATRFLCILKRRVSLKTLFVKEL